ncbi:hypothetical protein Hypma_010948 [Hypsizygus marmoreus]|uniref:F-box domain-containing protein n=1 Tax=Hypsizygus marmoreus TaxID=39966 RepID=A0A369JJN6_HYPMA|nr:hypothetical protein Hypma_010948 [Hypsizygus marmoreus]
MADLPYDVWGLIAENLPRNALLPLLPLNRAFFDIVLNIRYGTIDWAMLDDTMIRHLHRLQDPFIASRVRRLHIRAWFIQYLLKREKLFRDTSKTSVRFSFMQPTRKLLHLAQHSPDIRSSSLSAAQRIGKLASPRVTMGAMVKAINQMVNVTEYTFHWSDLDLTKETEIFLTSARSAFHSSLSKLELHAQIPKFEPLLSASNFVGLEELEFHFDFDTSECFGPPNEDYRGAKNEALLIGCIAPFINRQRSTLRALTISSSAKGDHSQFFRALELFPKLRQLGVRVWFDKEHLSDPKGIHILLRSPSLTLLKVELRPNYPPPVKYGHSTPYLPDAWSPLSQACLKNPAWLRNLESLIMPALNHHTTLSLLRLTPCSLASLCLFGRYLSFDEVADVISIHLGLRNLSLEVQSLNLQLIGLLANSLPQLLSLTLVLENGFADEYTLAIAFPEQSAVFQYPAHEHWTLFDLSLFLKAYRDDSITIIPTTCAEDEMMLCLLRTVLPSVRSFKGRGHTRSQWWD